MNRPPSHCPQRDARPGPAGLPLERLPSYAPDLNPGEGIWNYLKRVELTNVCCHDLNELHTALIRARERLRQKQDIIRACSRQCGYLI